MKLPDNQQDRDMIARELLIRFQTSPKHPLQDLNKAYRKFLTNLRFAAAFKNTFGTNAEVHARTGWP